MSNVALPTDRPSRPGQVRTRHDQVLVLVCALPAAAVPFTEAPGWLVPAVVAGLLAVAALIPRPDTALRVALLAVLLPPGLLPPLVQSLVELLSVLLAAAAAAAAPRARAPRPLPTTVWLLSLFLVWNVLSTWWSDDPAGGTDLLRRYALLLLLLTVVVVRTRGPVGVDRLLQTLAAAGWIVVACAVWAVVIGSRSPEGRLEVFDLNPNQLGNVLLLTTTGVMWRATGPGATRARAIQGLAFLACALALIALSGSRGSLLAYVLLLVGFTATRSLRRWGLASVVLALALVVLTPGLFAIALQRFEQQDPSQLSRGTLWAAGASLITDHPLGAGVGRGPYLMRDYIDARVALNHFATRSEYPAHNPLLEVGTDTGLVGMLLFGGATAAAAGTAVGASLRAARRGDLPARAYGACTGTATIAFLIVWLKSGGESYSFTTMVLLALWTVSDRAAGDRTGP